MSDAAGRLTAQRVLGTIDPVRLLGLAMALVVWEFASGRIGSATFPGPIDTLSYLRDNLIADRGRTKVEATDLEGKGTRSPFVLMCYVAARSKGAVDWFNGLPLYSRLVGKSNGLEYHHIFPQGVLYKKGGYSSDSVRDMSRVNE